jgi:integrase
MARHGQAAFVVAPMLPRTEARGMARKNLTDRFIKTRKAAPAGQRHDYHDAIVPGLALRVTDRGHKSFVLIARYPMKPKDPTRRALGTYGAITLEQARNKARNWLELIAKGIDPKVKEAKERAAAQRQQSNTFGAVAVEFLAGPASKFVKAKEAKRIIEKEFVRRWSARPIVDIEQEEISAAIAAIVKRGTRYQAHNAFGYIRLLFRWAIGTGAYGIKSSPVAGLSPQALAGERQPRARTLNDTELRAVWDAAEAMGYPYGRLLRLLILTGQRLREIANMRWREVDLRRRLLTIAADRMKGRRAHEVPLSDAAVALLEMLPHWTRGDFVFSTTDGAKPVNGFSGAKARIDKLSGVGGWVIHDLRRTARTHFSALPAQDMVRELIIAHARPGLHKVYDQHSYEAEKRECLDLWSKRLKGIVEPPEQNNIVQLAAAVG